jgi:hypothetical protein
MDGTEVVVTTMGGGTTAIAGEFEGLRFAQARPKRQKPILRAGLRFFNP